MLFPGWTLRRNVAGSCPFFGCIIVAVLAYDALHTVLPVTRVLFLISCENYSVQLRLCDVILS